MVSTRGDSHIHRIESLSLTFWNPRSIRVIDVLGDPTILTALPPSGSEAGNPWRRKGAISSGGSIAPHRQTLSGAAYAAHVAPREGYRPDAGKRE